MKKAILAVALLLATTCSSHAQEMNEIPMYGGKQKTAVQLKADDVFLAWSIKKFGTREKASDYAIRRGFDFLKQSDWRTAMKRFNQAWLLTPDRVEVVWGFGAALAYENEFEESERFYKKATALSPDNGRLLNDFGFLYQFWATKGTKDKTDKLKRLDRSIELFEQASRFEPSFDGIYYNWAVSLFFKENYSEAWQKAIEAEKLGGKSVDQKFIIDLTNKLPRPKI